MIENIKHKFNNNNKKEALYSKLNFAQCVFSFCEIYAYIFSISGSKISLKIYCLIFCVHYVLLLSIWSFIWLVIPFVSYWDGAIFIFISSLFLRPYHLFFRDGAVFILFIWVWVIGSFCREIHFGHCEASRDFINL